MRLDPNCIDVFLDDTDYKPTVINTPFLIPMEKGKVMNERQRIFNVLTKTFMDTTDDTCLVVRSRYGSGRTTFLKRLMQERNPERVLFITYRQTLARDVMLSLDLPSASIVIKSQAFGIVPG